MSKRWSTLTAVIVGVLAWGAAWIAIDLTVLQIYPLPPDLPSTASTSELLATRPNAAVALNVFGDAIALAAISFFVSRKSSKQAGIIVTLVVVALGMASSIALANFRWIHGVGYVTSLVLGLIAARTGGKARG